MLRVLHIISDTNIGGAGIHLLTFLEYHDCAKLVVQVLCPPQSRLLEQCRALGIQTHTSPYLTGDQSFGWRGLTSLLKDMCNIVRTQQIQLVHTHASFSGRLAAKILGVPRIVYTKHRLDWNPGRGCLKKQAIAWLNRLTCHKVIAVSQAVKKDLIESGLPKDKITLIYNGVDMEKLQRQARLKKQYSLPGAGDNWVVGMVARLEPEKGHQYFLEAAAMVLGKQPNVLFLVIGDGSLAKNLRNTATSLGLNDRVLFTGYQENIAGLIESMDILAVPSLTEAFGITMLEGMCLSKPCVVSAVGGLTEIAGPDGEIACLIPPANAEALAAKILYLLENPEIAQTMGRQGAKVAATKFSAKKMADEITKLYYQLF